jgi:hypothetical protein
MVKYIQIFVSNKNSSSAMVDGGISPLLSEVSEGIG